MKFTLALSACLATLASAQNTVEVIQDQDDGNIPTLVDLVTAADLVDTFANRQGITVSFLAYFWS